MLSLSSSIASLDPLSISTPTSPALIPIYELSASTQTAIDMHATEALDDGGDYHGDGAAGEWDDIEVGKGQCNFNSSEIDRIKGLKR